MTSLRFQCPCCGYYSLDVRGLDEICPICFWQDDNKNETYGRPAPERPRGPNSVHLWPARKNFLAFGAVDPRVKQGVRPPLDEELPPATSYANVPPLRGMRS